MQNTAPAENQADVRKQNIVSADEPEEPIVHLARALSASKPRRTGFPIPARLQQFLGFFQECYEYFNGVTKVQVAASQTAEWLLDNYYVIEQAVRQIEEDLPVDYYHRLPKTQDGQARVYLLALANTRTEQVNTRLDIEQIKSFLQTFQEITPLTTGELWALPLMLRLAVLESLAEALAAVTQKKWDKTSLPNIQKWLETSSQADPDATVANCILDLRVLATQDWKAFVELVSILERILKDDPADLYAQMDFETRNHYRGVVEDLADGSSLSEAEIAIQTV